MPTCRSSQGSTRRSMFRTGRTEAVGTRQPRLVYRSAERASFAWPVDRTEWDEVGWSLLCETACDYVVASVIFQDFVLVDGASLRCSARTPWNRSACGAASRDKGNALSVLPHIRARCVGGSL